MRPFITRWIITTIAVGFASMLSGIKVESFFSLVGAALILGLVNAFIRPVLLLLSLPLILVSLGFFILIINAVMFYIVGGIVPGFHVESFWSALFGSILVGIVSWILSAFFKGSDGKIHAITHHSQSIKTVQGRVIE